MYTSYSEPKLASIVVGNKKGFDNANCNRRAKGHIGSLLDEVGKLPNRDECTAKSFNAFFASVTPMMGPKTSGASGLEDCDLGSGKLLAEVEPVWDLLLQLNTHSLWA